VTAAGPGPAVETRGLVHRFKTGVEAVRGVDIVVPPGQVFGFLGPNGAGKTTTVRMLCTLLSITAGSARVAGADVAADPAGVRRKIGVALQEVGLDPDQTGTELLELQAGLFGLNRTDARRRAGGLLDLVGLADAAGRRVKTYSGGMKRRLDLATALVHEPAVLFLDEPTTGLDPASRITVWDEVRRINAAGTTIFLTTQYLEEADQLCEQLAIIDEGLIVAQGTPDELKATLGSDVVQIELAGADRAATRLAVEPLPGVDHVTDSGRGIAIYTSNGAQAVPQFVRALDDAGLTVGAVSVSRPSLDDVFLAATGRRIEGADERVGA